MLFIGIETEHVKFGNNYEYWMEVRRLAYSACVCVIGTGLSRHMSL
jgi:hypothetical protein